MKKKIIFALTVVGILVRAELVCAQGLNADSTKSIAIFEDLPFDDPTDYSALKNGETAEAKIKENVFVRAILSRKNAYVGEPVLLKYYLYSALNNTSRIVSNSLLPSFTSYELDRVQEDPVWTTMNHKRFRQFLIRQVQLIPFETGKLRIDPLVVENTINYSDAAGNPRSYSGDISSDENVLNVSQLPVDPTKTFSGLIGDFELETTIDADSISVDRLNHLHIIIKGSGNLFNVKFSQLQLPVGFETYQASKTHEISTSSYPMQGWVRLSIPFAVKEVGNLVIPPIKVRVFDILTNRYKDLASDSIAINVLPTKTKIIQENTIKTGSINYQVPGWSKYLVISMAIIFAALGFKYYHGKSNQKNGPVLEEPDSKSSEASLTDLTLGQVASLENLANPTLFLARAKEILIDFTQQSFKLGVSSEEALVKALSLQQADYGEEIRKVFEELNIMLYSPFELTLHIRKSIMGKLVSIITFNQELRIEDEFQPYTSTSL